MPAVTRVGDRDLPHCSGMTRAEGSPNVTVNGRAVSRQGDRNTQHLLPGDPCPGHAAPIAVGLRTVTVNGRPIGRVGDAISGCTRVAEGSPNVTAGGRGTGGVVRRPGRIADVMVAPGEGTLAVTWTAAARADGYKVQWRSGSEAFSPERQAEVTGTSYTIPDLEAGTEYTVRVIATRQDALDGAPSATVTGTPEEARQTVALNAPRSSSFIFSGIYALWYSNTGFGDLPAAWFAAGADTSLRSVHVEPSGRLIVDIGGGRNDLLASVRDDVDLTIETSLGSVTVEGIGGSDSSEPYTWTPSNAAEVTALYNAIRSRSSLAATLTFTGPA